MCQARLLSVFAAAVIIWSDPPATADVVSPGASNATPIWVAPPPVAPPAAPQKSAPAGLDNFLAWDEEKKSAILTNGITASSFFTFNLTNVSSEDVVIHHVNTSCGCTAADLPPLPWTIPPGGHGELKISMNVAGKMGAVMKTVTVSADKGQKVLFVTTTVVPGAPTQMMGSREQNQEIALADRQAIFKGDCASCHATPAQNKFGRELYVAACGICHDAEHRAEMIPDLHAIHREKNAEYWKTWVTHGKPGTLMPAFAKSEGGILTDEQIASLVEYLSTSIPSKPAIQAARPAHAHH